MRLTKTAALAFSILAMTIAGCTKTEEGPITGDAAGLGSGAETVKVPVFNAQDERDVARIKAKYHIPDSVISYVIVSDTTKAAIRDTKGNILCHTPHISDDMSCTQVALLRQQSRQASVTARERQARGAPTQAFQPQ